MKVGLQGASLSIISRFLWVCLLVIWLFPGLWLRGAEEPRLFRISDLGGDLRLLFQVTSEEERSLEQLYRDVKQNYLEAGLLLNTNGSIYHANLLAFSVNLNLVGHRTKRTVFSDAEVNNAMNNTYNIRLSFLRKKKLNFQLYTSNNFSTADRAFLERYFTTFKSTGLLLMSKGKFLPFQLNIYANRIKSESLTYAERDEKTTDINLQVTLLSKPKSRSFFTLRHKNYEELVYDLQYNTMDMTTTFSLNYGIKDMNLFSSFLTYNRMMGRYDLEMWSFRSNVLHYLKPHLYVNGTYLLNRDTSFGRSFTKHDCSGLLNHQLFESLISTILLGVRSEDSLHQQTQGLRHQESIQYMKKIPTGNLQLQYVNRNENANFKSMGDISDRSELFDFTFSDVLVYTWPGVDRNSIQVISPDRSRVYVEGIDYQLDIVNDVITIIRLPGGAISRSGNILVFFQYLAYPDFKLNSHFSQFDARLNLLKYFHLSYSRSVNDQKVTSDYTVPPFESYVKNELGIQLASHHINASYMVEHYNSTLSDYDSQSFRLSGQLKLFKTLTLSANMSNNKLTYQPAGYYSYFNAINIEASLKPRGRINVEGLFRSLRYKTSDFFRDRKSLLAKFQWDFRKIVLNIFYEYILTGTDSSTQGRHFFSIMIRRLF